MVDFRGWAQRILPARPELRSHVSFRIDAVTGAARLVRDRHPNKGIGYWLARAYYAFSFKWTAICFLITGAFFFLLSLAAADRAAYETALNNQVQTGDWAGGLQSLFILRMAASPRPLEFLVMIVAAPMIWNTLPPRWRFIIFPVIAQMLFILLSQIAFLPMEYALLNFFSSAADALRAL